MKMAEQPKAGLTKRGDQHQQIEPFTQQVRRALEHCSDPRWLAENSPLATSYFLGQHLDDHPNKNTEVGRGQLLQELLLEGANSLLGKVEGWPETLQRQREHVVRSSQSRNIYRDALRKRLEESDETLLRVIYWNYFAPENNQIKRSVELIASNVGVGRSTMYRWLNGEEIPSPGKKTKAKTLAEAITMIGDWLIEELRPALRIEAPPSVIAFSDTEYDHEQLKETRNRPQGGIEQTIVLTGRSDELKQGVSILSQRQTLMMTGSGGIGKTTLAAALAGQVAPKDTFWFTIRPGVKDNLNALYYELAYFLAQRGSIHLWRYLAAQGGAIQASPLAILMYDLAELKDKILLCFDDLDLLQAKNNVHQPLLELIVSLRTHVAQILIGQPYAIDINSSDIIIRLEEISLLDMAELLNGAGITLHPEHLTALHNYTHGNPRLLELFISLYRDRESLNTTFQIMEQSAPLESMLQRILKRMKQQAETNSDAQYDVLQALAVYRNPAPEDLWDTSILAMLRERRLVQHDNRGGVSIVPAFRPIIYSQIEREETVDLRRLHLNAAGVREERAEYTAAAYHYLKADRPDAALWTWHPYQLREIKQGQGATALALLRQLPVDRLSASDRYDLSQAIDALKLLIGELGDPPIDRENSDWSPDDIRPALDARTQGNIRELQSRLDEARDAYHAGLRTVERLAQETAIFHKNLSWVAMRQGELHDAWKEACRARYEAVNMQGYVQEEFGEYAVAHTYYWEALKLAEQCDYPQGAAKTYNNLTRLAPKLEQPDLSFEYGAKAVQLFREVGDLSLMSSAQINLALAYNQSRRPANAIPPAKEALAFFKRSGQPWGITAAAQNLAEAYLALVLAAEDTTRADSDTQSLTDAYVTLIHIAAAPPDGTRSKTLDDSQQALLDQAASYAQIVIEVNEPKTLPDGLRVMGEIKLAQKLHVEALRLIRRSIYTAQASKDKFLEGYAWRALGCICLVRRKRQMARLALDRAIAIFKELKLPQEDIVTGALRQSSCSNTPIS
jgi:tetratricopeptide (TPR) repeat protein